MKRTALALGLAFSATLAHAQAPEVPAPKCEPKPVYPGLSSMRYEKDRDAFQASLKAYQDCVKAYVDDRRKAMKANDDAARAAVEEHNAVMTKIRGEQDAAKKEQEEQNKK